MSTHAKVFVALLILGAVAILGAKFALPLVRDAWQRQTSDAAATKGTLRVGTDSWVGYFPLCSPEMARRMRTQGFLLRCEDDQANYAARFAALKAGELDLAFATIDSYLLNGAAHDFPGVIIAVIDESKGGDAIVARRSAAPNLDELKRKPGLRMAYTPASPSEHLIKALEAHFDVPVMRSRGWIQRVEASGSSDAFEKLKSGAADVAVLWEPDVTRALADPAYVKLLGTEDTQKLIVDILLASRRVLQERPDAVQALLDQYFQTLRHYREQPDELRTAVEDATELPADQVAAMLQGVAWASLNENGAEWFGITPSGLPGNEGLVSAIDATLGILMTVGDFRHNPIPDQDPYRITNRQFISALYLAQGGAAVQGEDPLARAFGPLDDKGWTGLKEVGTLKIEPIGFARATARLDDDGRATLDRIASRLRHYPNYRVVIKGHSGTGGDAQANVALSQDRARAVAEYLERTYRIDPDRIRAIGYGASRPLARADGETDRAYAYRLARVEVTLASEG